MRLNADDLLSLLSPATAVRMLALAHVHKRSIWDECIAAMEYFADCRKSDLPKSPPEHDPGIYLLHNAANGRIYIGQTNNFAQREATHRKGLEVGNHPNLLLREDAAMYGAPSFSFEIVERIPWYPWSSGHDQMLYARERYYIALLHPYYNLPTGRARVSP